jgi:hypothetical protein
VRQVSYVEYQRNYRLTVQLHTNALVARKTFWETLQSRKVTFYKLSVAIQAIESSLQAAERMYKQVLVRHGSSIKIVSLYVKFLEGVRNDPWAASHWLTELERLEKVEEEANERCVGGVGK